MCGTVEFTQAPVVVCAGWACHCGPECMAALACDDEFTWDVSTGMDQLVYLYDRYALDLWLSDVLVYFRQFSTNS